ELIEAAPIDCRILDITTTIKLCCKTKPRIDPIKKTDIPIYNNFFIGKKSESDAKTMAAIPNASVLSVTVRLAVLASICNVLAIEGVTISKDFVSMDAITTSTIIRGMTLFTIFSVYYDLEMDITIST